MKVLSRSFLYLSLLFVLYYLAHEDLLEVPRIRSYSILALSLPFLLAGLLGGTLSWHTILLRAGFHTTHTECIASMGLSVFGKYIPGKFWLLLGRAAYVSERRQYRLSTLSALSLNDQVIGLWVGLVVGGLGAFWVGTLTYGWIIISLWIALSLFIFSPWAHRLLQSVVRSLLRREIEVPAVSLESVRSVLPWVFAYWAAYSIGFYLLAASMSPSGFGLVAGLAFPLAASLGTLAVIAPAGIGVREGVLTAYLIASGLELQEAVSISVASRLWFLVGEAIFFCAGVLASRSSTR